MQAIQKKLGPFDFKKYPVPSDIDMEKCELCGPIKREKDHGLVYIGGLRKGTRIAEGKAVLINIVGSVYEGYFLNDERHGNGRQILYTGDYYEGQYVNGKAEGDGELYLANGHVYKGQYKNGLSNGQGVYEWPGGRRYEGEFKDGKRNGIGKMILEDGTSSYVEYKDDELSRVLEEINH